MSVCLTLSLIIVNVYKFMKAGLGVHVSKELETCLDKFITVLLLLGYIIVYTYTILLPWISQY